MDVFASYKAYETAGCVARGEGVKRLLRKAGSHYNMWLTIPIYS